MRSPFFLLLFFTLTLCLMLSIGSASSDTALSWQPLNEPGVGGRIDSIAVSPYNASTVLVGGDVLGARLSVDGGDRWSATSGWLNYEISDFTWHPQNSNIVWAGSLSGPHISTDGGSTWTVKRTGFPEIEDGRYTAPVEKVLFDPDSRHLLAFGGDHRHLKYERDILNYGTVWVSRDDGESWSLLSEIAKGGNIVSASYAGNSDREIYTAVWNRGVFYSGDDGKSWTKRSQGLPVDESGNIPISHLSVHPSKPDVVWVAIKEFGLYKTTDSGRNWQLLDRGIPSGGSEFWAIDVGADGRTLYAGNKNFRDRPGVYKSTDGGSRWQLQLDNRYRGGQKPYPGGIGPWWIEVDPSSTDVVYVGTDDAIYRSVDGGKSWTTLAAQQSSGRWRGNGFSGLVARNVEWNPLNQQHMVVQGMDGAKAVQSWDGGDSWRIENPGLSDYSGGHDVAFAPGVMFSVFGQGDHTTDLIARSRDAGESWTALRPPISATDATQVHVDSKNANRLWVVINRQLWYSDNANQTTAPQWTRLTVGSNNNAVGEIAVVPGKGEAFYIATDGGIYRTDNGSEFRLVGGLSGAEGVELAVSSADPDVLYAVQKRPEQGGVWRYHEPTDTWSSVWTHLSATARIGDIAVHPTKANALALVTDDFPYHDQTWATGVWISQDGGETWRQENEGLPMLRGSAIAFHPSGESLTVGLGGAGFYTADTSAL